MTESYHFFANAIAERVNSILKHEFKQIAIVGILEIMDSLVKKE